MLPDTGPVHTFGAKGNRGGIMNWEMVRVESYAGYKAEERPVRFFVDEREFPVERVLERWTNPDSDGFRVSTPAGVYTLRHNLADDSWTAEPWRARTY